MKKSVAIFGLGKFGTQLAIELSNGYADVLAVDSNQELVNQVAGVVRMPVCADVKDKATMAQLGLDAVDSAVVCMAESLESSIVAIMTLQENGVRNIWVKAASDAHARIYKALGATRTFMPEKESAVNMARYFTVDNFDEFIELSDRVGLVKLVPRPEWIGHNLVDLSLRKKYGLNIVAMERNGEMNIDIDPYAVLTDDVALWVVADKKATSRLKG